MGCGVESRVSNPDYLGKLNMEQYSPYMWRKEKTAWTSPLTKGRLGGISPIDPVCKLF